LPEPVETLLSFFDRRLIVFTRFPFPGQTKTRLIPALGTEAAAGLQSKMTRLIVSRARRVASELEVHFTGADQDRMAGWLGPGIIYRPQVNGDLGQRMAAAFETGMKHREGPILLIGTDAPELNEANLEKAFTALTNNDLVLGPARDGGYYLIGLNRPQPRLFEDINWGAEDVLARTISRADALGLSVALLKELVDLDRPDDLPVLLKGPQSLFRPASLFDDNQNCQHGNLISIIVPTLNEEKNITVTLKQAFRTEDVEIIIVDGSSCDHTARLAKEMGARVVIVPAGRARQMNVGAVMARGPFLLFLHADTLLPSGYDRTIRQTLTLPGTSVGAFNLGITGQHGGLRIIESVANLRSRFLGLPYGDQALFLKSDLFWKMGGFRDIPIMEDFALVRRSRRFGRIRLLRRQVQTSTRRWLFRGLTRTTIINQIIVLGYYWGVDLKTLSRIYQGNRRA
jgi:rSAM/selenodomain-associated transferase 2/rSAM/selenodomain-associated transferase 1